MRDDMAGVIVERPRIKPWNTRKGRSKAWDDMTSHGGMRRAHPLRGERVVLGLVGVHNARRHALGYGDDPVRVAPVRGIGEPHEDIAVRARPATVPDLAHGLLDHTLGEIDLDAIGSMLGTSKMGEQARADLVPALSRPGLDRAKKPQATKTARKRLWRP